EGHGPGPVRSRSSYVNDSHSGSEIRFCRAGILEVPVMVRQVLQTDEVFGHRILLCRRERFKQIPFSGLPLAMLLRVQSLLTKLFPGLLRARNRRTKEQ